MTVGGIISAIIVGLIIGALGRLVVPGKQKIGLLLTLLVGIIAALLGTFLVSQIDSTPGFFVTLIVQVVLAAIGVSILAGTSRGKRR